MEDDSIIHVAYAEDHQLVRKSIIKVLEESGKITVDFEAEDGTVLLEKLEQASTRPEICIIDISMPEMDGFTALLEIRKRWPDMKTLMLTGFSSEQYIIRTIQVGANGYLLKKCSENEIIDAIISIHENGYYYSECANSTLFHLVRTRAIKTLQFSEDEIEYLKYCCNDLNVSEIAERMGKTTSGAEGCRDRLYEKLNVNSRTSLVLFAVAFGYVTFEINQSGNTLIPQLKQKKL